ncbi:MAG: hypothetical protein QOD99_3215 [Chthoniobacter sp.]|jgi:2',3'-cyclic-nucleotide 2'-phosphodiesterase (5'-nucleotidase family)|nr:hypothetical protein [Chthoniobacter sp.]
MPRRASSTVQPSWIIGCVVLLGAAIVGGRLLYQNVSDPYRTLTPLDVTAYVENANSLRGNVYKISVTVGTQLAWSPTAGRLYSVEVEGKPEVLAVLIPAQFNHLNIQKGQRYFFKIEIGDKGILRASDVRKV